MAQKITEGMQPLKNLDGGSYVNWKWFLDHENLQEWYVASEGGIPDLSLDSSIMQSISAAETVLLCV
jgi:hypothetical protein